MDIKNVAVLGANGNMGHKIAGIISSFGNVNVYLISKKKESSELAIPKILDSTKTNSIENRLFPMDYEEGRDVLGTMDWIVEAVAEDYTVKKSIFEYINDYVNDDCIISTCTSGLSINILSSFLSESRRKNFLGTHFFNPPYSMPLCEIIISKDTDSNLYNDMAEYLKNVLFRKVVLVFDRPGFLANRIGFHFLNEALLLAEKFQDMGGIDYVDYLFSGYTGRVMKPIETVNFVGLDVHKSIIDNIFDNTDDEYNSSFVSTSSLEKMIFDSRLGVKSKIGFYKKYDEDSITTVYDIKSSEYREKISYNFKPLYDINEFIKIGKYVDAYKVLFESEYPELEIVKELLIKYIVYSIIVSKECAFDIRDCDIAMAYGFNWCPPFALKDLIEHATDIEYQLNKYISLDVLEKYNILDIVKSVHSSFDYRRYIRA